MAVEIIGNPEAVKRYRELLHSRGTFTKRYQADIDAGIMLPKPDDYMTTTVNFRQLKATDFTSTEDRTDTTDAKPELMKIVGVANENAVDRMDERLDPRGVDITNFKKNPVLLADHMYMTRAVIGAVENVTPEDDGVKFVANLGDPEKADLTLAQTEVRSLIKQGLLKTVSVGFIPKKIRAPEYDGEGRLLSPPVILDWELLEISVVAVPANAGSTFEMRQMAKNLVQKLAYIDASHTIDIPNAKLLTATQSPGDNSQIKSKDDEPLEAKDMEELKQLLEKLLSIAEEQKSLMLSQSELLKSLGEAAKGSKPDPDPMEDDEDKKAITELRAAMAANSKAIDDIATVLKSLIDNRG